MSIQKNLLKNVENKTKVITKDQLTAAADFDAWKNAMTELWNVAYDARALCASSDLRTADETVDLTAVFAAIRNLLALVGDVNGFKLYANKSIAIDVLGFVMKDNGVFKSETLKTVEDNIRTSRAYYKTLTEANSTEEFRKACLASLDALIAERDSLSEMYKHRHEERTRNTFKTFAHYVEYRLAAAINGQRAKSRAELEAEAEARRKARNAAAKARKAAKKNAK